MDNIVKENRMPLIPVRGIVPFSGNEFTIEIGRKQSIEALFASDLHNGYVILVPQIDEMVENPTVSDLFGVAALSGVVSKTRMPSGNYRVKFETYMRMELKKIYEEAPYFEAEGIVVPLSGQDNDEEEVLFKMLVSEVEQYMNNGLFNRALRLRRLLEERTYPENFASVAAFYLRVPTENKLKYFGTSNFKDMLTAILSDIETERQLSELEVKLDTEMRESVAKHQKEYFLREKMKAIHKELGDEHSTNTVVENFKERLKKARMPKAISKKVDEEIKRFEITPIQSSESGVIRNYIEWFLDLPWSKHTKDKQDLAFAQDVLDGAHFGLERVKDRILEYLAVKAMTGKTPPAILCLSGPPGVGKTSLAKSIAESLGRKFVKISLGGIRDEAEIRGHRKTYIGAMPGRIIQGMKKAGTVNPVFLLDEIDKMSGDFRGDPSSAMLEVLDPEQNTKFSDHYLEEEYDLARVLFIATANELDKIPAPLRDRMDIIHVSSYTEMEKFEIAKRHLINRQLKAHGLTTNMLNVKDESIMDIIRYYTKEAGVRQLERTIGAICRKSARELLTDKHKKKIEIDSAKLIEFLGKHKFDHSLAEKDDQIGVVTGLAYTQFGGDILPVEVTYFKGAGKIVLTGKLGDVMKESARIAVSYVRSNAKAFGIDEAFFDGNDIHIHVPEGATPKDGPSAGITMTTALVSALTKKKVRKDIGMTGEITLRGRVLPIGGLKEKSISAHRSGLKTILIPKENEKDLDDIPQTVKDTLEIIPVTDIDEVLKLAIVG